MSWLLVEGRPATADGALRGSVSVPGDKSISHRALMLGALGDGPGRIEGFLPAGDCLATLDCLRKLGVEIAHAGTGAATTLEIHGRGLRGLQPPSEPLDCRRSGTTMRLLAGILAGQSFDSVLSGAPQLLRRPMRRITAPLTEMGAVIRDTDGHAPLTIEGVERLRGGEHVLPIASAQVKSALLLAGLYAEDAVTVRQPGPARDHTERMLAAQVEPVEGYQDAVAFDTTFAQVRPDGIARLRPLDMIVPGDFSSAAFLMAAALLRSGSEITLVGVGVNPTRTGLLDVLRKMGADLVVHDARLQGGEPVADVTVRASVLTGTEIGGPTVVRMIDEFPILAVVATQAEGQTVVREAAELRVKETDRILTVVTELRKLGARIEPCPDGFVVEGPTRLKGTEVESHDDHRLGMALTVAGLMAEGETAVRGAEYIPDSFPGFVETLRTLGAGVRHGI